MAQSDKNGTPVTLTPEQVASLSPEERNEMLAALMGDKGFKAVKAFQDHQAELEHRKAVKKLARELVGLDDSAGEPEFAIPYTKASNEAAAVFEKARKRAEEKIAEQATA